MSTKCLRTTTSIFGLICLAAGSAPAFAQADSDQASVSPEIVVTAQRREERQVDVPITITALGPQQLATANVQALPDIVRARNGVDHDGDLIGTAVIAAVVLLMPAVVPFASIVATVSGGILGLLCGLMLLRTSDTTR